VNDAVILSLDPGITTGYVIATRAGEYPEWGELTMWAGLEDLIKKWLPACLVYEAFTLYASKARQMINSSFEAVQVIGVIMYLCEQHKIRVTHQPALWASRIRLPYAVSHTIHSEHARSAARHAVVYFRRHRLPKEAP
jgi:hypothetical protein